MADEKRAIAVVIAAVSKDGKVLVKRIEQRFAIAQLHVTRLLATGRRSFPFIDLAGDLDHEFRFDAGHLPALHQFLLSLAPSPPYRDEPIGRQPARQRG